jgi:hypothetical protein
MSPTIFTAKQNPSLGTTARITQFLSPISSPINRTNLVHSDNETSAIKTKLFASETPTKVIAKPKKDMTETIEEHSNSKTTRNDETSTKEIDINAALTGVEVQPPSSPNVKQMVNNIEKNKPEEKKPEEVKKARGQPISKKEEKAINKQAEHASLQTKHPKREVKEPERLTYSRTRITW